MSLADNQKQNAPFGVSSDGTSAIEILPNVNNPELADFIVKNSTGYYFSAVVLPAQNSSAAISIPAAPDGTRRVSIVVDGVIYYPLVANCPAASCTNGDPIANALGDVSTQSYLDAVAKKGEKDFNIATSALGIFGTALRGVRALAGLADTSIFSRGANSVDSTLGLGKITGNFSAIDLGPLANKYAETFSGGRYTTITLQNDTVLYRAGTANNPLGEYFSLESPSGVLQTRIDKAVLPEWPSGAKSPIDTSFAVKIPAGTQIYVGEVGTQSGFYVGGTQQIVIPKPWTINGVQVINSSPLK